MIPTLRQQRNKLPKELDELHQERDAVTPPSAVLGGVEVALEGDRNLPAHPVTPVMKSPKSVPFLSFDANDLSDQALLFMSVYLASRTLCKLLCNYIDYSKASHAFRKYHNKRLKMQPKLGLPGLGGISVEEGGRIKARRSSQILSWVVPFGDELLPALTVRKQKAIPG
ncbi:hypothetical protein HDU98_003870 [Podochytrium sp. JEL0797]|nr:hypothetical protein HDU98_003870 [Podochytrium sp. JEL0797]